MDGNFRFFVNPGGFRLEHLPDNPVAITMQKADGETIALDPRETQVKLSNEHPPVERMEGDWGAICEVYRKSSDYYVSVSGVPLAAGDSLTIRYQDGPGVVTLKVIEIENGRARIEPPAFKASGGQQNS